MVAVKQNMDKRELSQLAAQAADDSAALEELLRTIHGPLVGYLHALGVQDSQVDDLAQEVSISMYRSLDRYDESQPFIPWLFSIARNYTYNHWRKFSRARRKIDSFELFMRQQVESLFSNRSQLDTNLVKLESCLEELPAKQCAILKLRYFEDMNSASIAEQLSMSADAVRQTLVRVRGALRKCMQERR